MASDEMRKKWGTIFMGEREASVEQLNAMQEPLRREKQQKENAEDYMERVRARAADRAREILGAAYTERQKVLDEAKAEAAMQKQLAARECDRLKAEGENIRQQAQLELEKAHGELEAAQKIREAAHGEGFQHGMDEAAAELHEFRAELGQSLATLLHAIARQRKNILDRWREELVELVQCAAQAGSGYVLEHEHEAILRSLVCQALDQLENRSIVSVRVNPEDEETVSGLFKAARERAPDLKQWIVTGDSDIERGGLIADSGSGSVDFQRQNFRQLVDGILRHLAIPDAETSQPAEVRDIVEREVAHIAALTPEPDQPQVEIVEEPQQPEPAAEEIEPQIPDTVGETETVEAAIEPDIPASPPEPAQTVPETAESENMDGYAETAAAAFVQAPQSESDTSLADLEDELFPLEDEPPASQAAAEDDEKPDARILSEGGFL